MIVECFLNGYQNGVTFNVGKILIDVVLFGRLFLHAVVYLPAYERWFEAIGTYLYFNDVFFDKWWNVRC